MIRPIALLLFLSLTCSATCYGQRNDRLSWQNLFEIVDMPAGPSREARIADFHFGRVPNKPNEWSRDLQRIDEMGRLVDWTETIALVKEKQNMIRYITTYSPEFRRMLKVLTQPSNDLPGDEGVGGMQLPSEERGDRIVERYRKDDRLIEVLSYRDRSGLENWICQITKGAF